MSGFIEGHDRLQSSLLPACVDALMRSLDLF
jgi:hypothetical protein